MTRTDSDENAVARPDLSGRNTATRHELVFGLIGPAGVRLEDIEKTLKDKLAEFGYQTETIRLSDLLQRTRAWTNPSGSSEFERLRHLQNVGDSFRGALTDGAALARASIAEVRQHRAAISGGPDKPAFGRAFILRQLKHPEEVELLRRVYSSNFLVLAGHAPKKDRIDEFAKRLAAAESRAGEEAHFYSQASEFIQADETSGGDFGQNTQDVYPMADFFVNMRKAIEDEIKRFIWLLFGHPFHTPTFDEYAMYQARAVALRSSDSNRQVGAVIVTLRRDLNQRVINTDIVAVGMNEVPRGGGGFYWDRESPDARDQYLMFWRKVDRAQEIKIGVLSELIEKMKDQKWLKKTLAKRHSKDLAREILPRLRGSKFANIGEFGRPVHAETAALIDAARRGVAVDGNSIYVTTFPCHNCAKHIIAAGLRRVVYLEPYPKSQAQYLYEEECFTESDDGMEKDGKVVFASFSGVAPRRYQQLFSMTERGGKAGLTLTEWTAQQKDLAPRYVIPHADLAYLEAERQELTMLPTTQYEWDRAAICPETKADT